MPCWHVGPCGVGCDGYVANPVPTAPMEFVRDYREEVLQWMQKYSDLQQRYIDLQRRYQELLEKTLNQK